jgi:hypothetical protein
MSNGCEEHGRELDLKLFDANEKARIAAIDKRLDDADRLAKVEAELSSHNSVFREREKAELQAQRERELSAQAVQKALEEAAKAQAEALQAALKNANELELERVARVEDKVADGKEAAKIALTASEKAVQQAAIAAKETLDHHNELLKQMNAKDATYQTKDLAQATKDQLEKEISEIKEALSGTGGEKTAKKQWNDMAIGIAATAIVVINVIVQVILHFA